MINKTVRCDLSTPSSSNNNVRKEGTKGKVFRSIRDVKLYRTDNRLTDIMVNKPFRFNDVYIQSGEILEILLADDESVTESALVKVYSSGEILFLPGHVIGNFIDCSSKLIGSGVMYSNNNQDNFINESLFLSNVDIPPPKPPRCKNTCTATGDTKSTTQAQPSKNESLETINEIKTTSNIQSTFTEDLDGIEKDLMNYPIDNAELSGNSEKDIDIDVGNEGYVTMVEHESNQSPNRNESPDDNLDEEYVTIEPSSHLTDNLDEVYVTIEPSSHSTDLLDSIDKSNRIKYREYQSVIEKRNNNQQLKKVSRRPLSESDSIFVKENASSNDKPNIGIYGVTEVIDLFSKLSLTFCREDILALDVDGSKLMNFTESDLHEKIGLSIFEARVLYHYIRGWRPVCESETNWRENKESADFSTIDLMFYLGYFGYSKISRYMFDYKVDGALFMKLLEDDLLMKLEFDDGSKLEKHELDDLHIRFFHKRERTRRIFKKEIE